MRRSRETQATAWIAAVVLGLLIAGDSSTPDPGPEGRRAPPLTLVAVDLAGRQRPVLAFDGRRWRRTADEESAPSADDPRAAIMGLDVTGGAAVHMVRIVPPGTPGLQAARDAMAAAAEGNETGARAGAARDGIAYHAPEVDAGLLFVTVVVAGAPAGTGEAAVSGWVRLDADDGRAVARPLWRQHRVADGPWEVPRRPLGVVAGAGGPPVWVMHARARGRDVFTLVEVRRRRPSADPAQPDVPDRPLLDLRELDLEEQR